MSETKALGEFDSHSNNGQYESYSSYQQTSRDWLEVPEHWDVRRLKFCAQINPSKKEVDHLNPKTEVTFLPMENVSEEGAINHEETQKIEDVIDGYTYFQENDVLVAKITPCFENGKGALAEGLKNDLGFGTTEFVVLRPNELLNNKFLYYVTASNMFRKVGEGQMKGAAGQKRVPDEFFQNFPQFIPPQEEQEAIVEFLDREMERIDKLMEQKENLIDLLKEKRSALIKNAVTSGVEDNLEKEESSVGWLENIPKDWEESRLGFNAKFIVPQRDKPEDLEGPIPWVRIEDFNGMYLSDSKSGRGVTEETVAKDNLSVFPEGTVLCSCSCNMGVTAIAERPLISNQTFIGINTGEKLKAQYTYYLMSACKEHLTALSTGAIQQYLSKDDFSHFKIPLPSLEEQEKIANYLSEETEKIDSTIEKTQEGIDRLKEYRKALITETVTGQIDVRGEV